MLQSLSAESQLVHVNADNLALGGLHYVRDRPPALHSLLQSDPHLSLDG